MVALAIQQFAGMIPRVSNRLLPDNASEEAVNCDLKRGLLQGMNQPKQVHSFGTPVQRAFPIRKDDGTYHWLGFTFKNVDLLKGPLVNDAYDRWYWAGDELQYPQYNTQARILTSSDPFILGVPRPANTPTLNVAGGSGVLENRAYVYTFVSQYGEEGPPSEPITASGYENSTWQLGNMSTSVPSSAYRPTFTKRIYRTVAGKSSTDYFWVADIPLANATFNDTNLSSLVALADGLQSEQWYAPPDYMEGLTAHPNGFLVGWKGRDLYFSEPYRPHAWPPGYTLSTETPIVGLGVVAQTVVVLTESTPYTCTGGQPSMMSLAKIEAAEPCLGRFGIVSHRHGVLYPSRNGIIAISPNGAELITRTLITPEQWYTEYNPYTLVAAKHDTEYIALRAVGDGFLFMPNEQSAAWSLIRAVQAKMVQTNPYTGIAYLLNGDSVFDFNPEDAVGVGYSWTSKKFYMEKPVNFGACRFEFETAENNVSFFDYLMEFNEDRILEPLSPVGAAPLGQPPTGGRILEFTGVPYNSDPLGGSPLFSPNDIKAYVGFIVLTIWADDVKMFEHNLFEERQVKLPAGFKATTWQFKFETNLTLHRFVIAETGRELARA